MQPVEVVETPIHPDEEGLRHFRSHEREHYQHAGYVKIRAIGEMHVQIDDVLSLFNLMVFSLRCMHLKLIGLVWCVTRLPVTLPILHCLIDSIASY
jgi:hypothetical protein